MLVKADLCKILYLYSHRCHLITSSFELIEARKGVNSGTLCDIELISDVETFVNEKEPCVETGKDLFRDVEIAMWFKVQWPNSELI